MHSDRYAAFVADFFQRAQVATIARPRGRGPSVRRLRRCGSAGYACPRRRWPAAALRRPSCEIGRTAAGCFCEYARFDDRGAFRHSIDQVRFAAVQRFDYDRHAVSARRPGRAVCIVARIVLRPFRARIRRALCAIFRCRKRCTGYRPVRPCGKSFRPISGSFSWSVEGPTTIIEDRQETVAANDLRAGFPQQGEVFVECLFRLVRNQGKRRRRPRGSRLRRL